MNNSLDWFDESDYFMGPQLTDEMVRIAESALGFKLPDSYIDLLRIKNGGTPRFSCYPTQEPTGWANNHIQVEAVFGIAGKHGIDAEYGSRYLITEWGYPDIGIVIGMTPSAGPEAIMLNYTLCGPHGEPQVIYVDTETADGEPNIIVLAPNFLTFTQGFTACVNFDSE